MSKSKIDEIKKISNEERSKKIKELKLELIKSRAGASKGGSQKIREAKKYIARILTFNKSNYGELKKNK